MKRVSTDASPWHIGAYIVLTGAVLLYIIAAEPNLVITSALIGMVMLMPVFFVDTKSGLVLLIILRPIIDTFSFYSITVFNQVNINLNGVVAIFVCVWAITVWAREKIVWRKLTGVWWLVAFLGVGLLSFVNSIDFTVSLSEWLRLLSIVVLFIIAQHLAQRDQSFVHVIIQAVALSAVIPIVVGAHQLVTNSGLSFGGLDNRMYGTFGHPNVLGFYLVIVLSVVIIAYLAARQPDRSLFYPLIIWSSIVALLFTYTRGAWLGLGVVLVILGLTKYRKPLIIAAAAVCFFIVFGQVINSLFITNANINLNEQPLIRRFTARSEEADSIDWRYQVFQTMAPKVLEHPWLGVGIGNFVTLRKASDIGLFEDPEAHNDYLRLAIEIGLPGLAVYVSFLLSVLWAAVHNYLAWQKTAWQKWYALCLIGIILAFMGMSLGDNILQGTPVLWLFIIIIATFVTLKKSSAVVRRN